jgi:hypothetical protein
VILLLMPFSDELRIQAACFSAWMLQCTNRLAMNTAYMAAYMAAQWCTIYYMTADCLLIADVCRMVIGPTGLSWSSEERVGENLVRTRTQGMAGFRVQSRQHGYCCSLLSQL